MATRIVEGKKPYTGGKAIEIDENKVISLRLREENNLIIRDEGDNEIYVDLQLPDGITPLDAFPVGITVGRVLIADDWDVTGTLACFKTTSGDNIKLLYGDNGKVYIDNGTGLFKQIYLKGEVDALLQALRDYVDAQLALKQDKLIAGDYIEINENVISAVIPTMSRFLSIWNASSGEPISFPASTPFLYTTGDYYLIEGVGVSDNYRPAPIEYDGSASTIPETDEVANGDVYIYDGAVWLLQSNHGKTVTFQNIAGDPYDNTNLATALNDKQDTLVNQSNIKSINNQSLLGNGDLSIAEVPSGGTDGQVLTQTSQGPSRQNATGGADIEYKTQAEYNALPSSKLTDGKHYVIYTVSGPIPPTPGSRPTITGFNYVDALSSYTGGDANGITWKPDGTKFYITGEQNNTVYQYSVSTPRDVTTATYDNKSVATTLNVSNSIIFSDDGLTMWIAGGWRTGYVYKWTLSTAWDVSTASYVGDATGKSNISFYGCTGYWMANNGQYLYVLSRENRRIRRYTMLTPYDITTLDATYQEYSNLPYVCHKVLLNPQGTQLFYYAREDKKIHICALSTAFDLTTLSETSQYTVPTPNSVNITSVTIDNEGNSMWIGGYNIGGIYQYSTTTA